MAQSPVTGLVYCSLCPQQGCGSSCVASSASASRVRPVLAELRVQQLHDGQVQPVEPDHGAVRVIAVVVEGPRRRDDEVARVHGDLFAVHRGVGAVAVQDEAQRGLRVAVRRRDLAWQDQLQSGVQAVRDAGASAQAGVFQHQHAALGLARRDELAAFLQPGPDRRPVPQVGLAGRVGQGRDQPVQHFPQGRAVGAADLRVEGGAFGSDLLLRVRARQAIARHALSPCAARTATSMRPMPWNSATITSPGTTGPTPSGVPV
jgi:hypothetical protein